MASGVIFLLVTRTLARRMPVGSKRRVTDSSWELYRNAALHAPVVA